MINVWTNTDELQVLESLDHPLKARAYIAKWDIRDRSEGGIAPNLRDGEPRRVYYSIRLELEAGGHKLRTYGEGLDRKQSYYGNQKNAVEALKAIFKDLGIPFKVLKEDGRVGVPWRKRLTNLRLT